MSDNWVTLHSENGDEIVVQTFSIMGMAPWRFADGVRVGCFVACDGGQSFLVTEHISEVKELICVEDDPEPQCRLADDRAQLLQQIDRQADTIFSQGKTIEYWQKKYDDEHAACTAHCDRADKLMHANSGLATERDTERHVARNLQLACDNHWAEVVRVRAASKDLDAENQRLMAEVYSAAVREESQKANVASLVKKLNEASEALTRVTQERDLLRANSRSHYFKITQEFDPKNSGLCDYAKWPGTKE